MELNSQTQLSNSDPQPMEVQSESTVGMVDLASPQEQSKTPQLPEIDYLSQFYVLFLVFSKYF